MGRGGGVHSKVVEQYATHAVRGVAPGKAHYAINIRKVHQFGDGVPRLKERYPIPYPTTDFT